MTSPHKEARPGCSRSPLEGGTSEKKLESAGDRVHLASGRDEPSDDGLPIDRESPDGEAVSSVSGRPRRFVSALLMLPIRAYKLLVSPLLPRSCRFYPSCSSYAMKAIEVHGPLFGSLLSLGRIARCHPFHPGGYDPVPERRDGKAALTSRWGPEDGDHFQASSTTEAKPRLPEAEVAKQRG